MKNRFPPPKPFKKKCPDAFKVSYPTKKAVLTAINNHFKDLSYYKCPHCREYHLTRCKQTKGETDERDIQEKPHRTSHRVRR